MPTGRAPERTVALSRARPPSPSGTRTRATKPSRWPSAATRNGGGGGIRTHEALADLPVFKTGAIDRSATPPERRIQNQEFRIRGREKPGKERLPGGEAP